ncbi:MAG: glycosyl transferase family 1 [Marinilabiliales bacterium]|nr:MAG: glycosyl transferase family 1 [Marinilabiliales bacterium]
MGKIIFIFPKMASFIRLDIEILKERYEVVENSYPWQKKHLMPIILIRQFFFLLKNLRKTEHVIISFGGWWAWLPTLMAKWHKKPSYIIIHGTDAAGFPEIKYGNMRKPLLRTILRKSYRRASYLLPVSESLIYTENTYYEKGRIIKQGIEHFFPKNKTPKIVIPNAIDTEKWQNLNKERKPNQFITVLSPGQFVRKGGEIILNIAPSLPQYDFTFIGIEKPAHLNKIPENVRFIGRTQPESLLEIYSEATYYLQLSIFEGFGVALCEAMACGCIPIVANTNAMPYIIGDSGYVVQHRDEKELIELILTATFEKKTELGKKARQRIVDDFTVENRKNLLFDTLEKGEVKQ